MAVALDAALVRTGTDVILALDEHGGGTGREPDSATLHRVLAR
jgi:hypothetical protein